MAANVGKKLATGIISAMLLVTQGGCGQAVAPKGKEDIVYTLPAETTTTIARLLAGRTPTYVFLNHQTQEVTLLTFSFEKWSEIQPEHQLLLKKGNRVMKIDKKIYPILFDYDISFYPQKSYLDGGGMFNSVDVYVNMRGEFLKATNWAIDKKKEK